MGRRILLLCFLCAGLLVIQAGCGSDARTLTKAELEARVKNQGQFASVNLTDTLEHTHSGEATDQHGGTYTVTVVVTADTISYKAEPKDLLVDLGQLEEAASNMLALDDVKLVEKNKDLYEGSGTAKVGGKCQLSLTRQRQKVKGKHDIEFTVEYRPESGKMSSLTLIINSKNQSRQASFSP